jgi:D-serine dehydratase
MHPTLDLQALEAFEMPATWKGLASRAVGQPMHTLGRLGLSLLEGDLPLPVAVLKESALAHNLAWMRAFTERAGVSLCPHGKTTMAPQLFDRQLREGCWGLTAATASHVRTYRQFGVRRILLANQLIDRASINLVLDELRGDPGFDFFCLVDSLAGLRLLQEALAHRPIGRPLQVLLEVGVLGGRSGVRTLDEGLALGRALRDAAPAIALRGIEAFEGIAPGSDAGQVELSVHTMLENVVLLMHRGEAEAWFASGERILTAGGSAFFDLAAAVLTKSPSAAPLRVVLRSGCYLTHDVLFYGRMQARMRQRAGALWGSGPGLRNAIEVWAAVQSLPEAGRAICALGRRDVSHDIELPRPIWWFRPGLHSAPIAVPSGVSVTGLNDQHAYIDLGPASSSAPLWQVGDLVGFGVAHPCTTFDKWPLLHCVDDAYRVTGGIRTYF